MKFKKFICFSLAVILCFSLVGCGEKEVMKKDIVSVKEIENVAEDVAKIAEDVIENTEEVIEKDKEDNEEKEKEKEKEEKKNEVLITVINKYNVPENWDEGRYSDRVEFDFEIENLTSRDIKGVQGTIIIKDLFEEEISSFNCDFTGEMIPAYGIINVDGIGIDINQFMDDHIKLYNEKFDDLNFEYEVKKIVYSDGISNNQNDDSLSRKVNSNVLVSVTNKRNLEEDWDADRYSPRVEFDFKITNNGDKTIKGIQGILTVKDLFDKDIISISCDFTGNEIYSKKYIEVNDLGIDINQFMDDHIKLYNEKFDDLNFEYKISKIVYSDGTVENY